MLDKTSKKFLEYMDSRKDDTFFYGYDEDFPEEFGSKSDCGAMIRYLEQERYIEYIKTTSGITAGIRLSHKGLKRKEFSRHEIVEYLEEKWIDLLAMLLSLAAIFISLF